MIPIPSIAILAAVKRHFALVASCFAIGVIVVLALLLWRAEHRLSVCTVGRQQDAQQHHQAQRDAERLNAEYVAQVTEKQKEVTHAVSTSYRSDLVRLRSELGRVRSQAAPRPASAAGLPKVSRTTAGTDGEALRLPADQLLLAAEAELQLNALITWVEAQAKAVPNPTPGL